MSPVRLHHVPIELVLHEFAFLLIKTSAGFPSPAQDDLEEPIDLSARLVQHPAASYIMRVDGNSITGAGIFHDNFSVVNRAKEPRAGAIVVALVHGDRKLKRLARIEGRFWLIPEADGYPRIIVDENVEIWGVPDGVARRLP